MAEDRRVVVEPFSLQPDEVDFIHKLLQGSTVQGVEGMRIAVRLNDKMSEYLLLNETEVPVGKNGH